MTEPSLLPHSDDLSFLKFELPVVRKLRVSKINRGSQSYEFQQAVQMT